MKVVYSFIVLVVLLACCNNKKTSIEYAFKFPDSAFQSKIRDTLRKLPFVKRSQIYFDSVSNHTEGVSFIIDTFRNKIYPNAVFYVKKEKHFQRLYRFEVNPQTMEIKINDTDTGEYITMEEYYKLNPEDKY
jgi:hypothetical protein